MSTLSQMVRAKFPGAYDDLDDKSLDAMVRAKFPGAYDDIPAEECAIKRFAGGMAEMLNPVSMVQGVANMVMHPIDSIVTPMGEELSKAKESYDQGRYSEALGHGAAGVLPMIGPMAGQVGQGIADTGDVARGLGQATGMIAGGKMLEGIPKVGKYVPKVYGEALAIAKDAANLKVGLLPRTFGEVAAVSVASALGGPGAGATVYSMLKVPKVLKAIAEGRAKRLAMSTAKAQGELLKMTDENLYKEFISQQTPEGISLQQQVRKELNQMRKADDKHGKAIIEDRARTTRQVALMDRLRGAKSKADFDIEKAHIDAQIMDARNRGLSTQSLEKELAHVQASAQDFANRGVDPRTKRVALDEISALKNNAAIDESAPANQGNVAATYQDLVKSVKGLSPEEAIVSLKKQGVPDFLHANILKNASPVELSIPPEAVSPRPSRDIQPASPSDIEVMTARIQKQIEEAVSPGAAVDQLMTHGIRGQRGITRTQAKAMVEKVWGIDSIEKDMARRATETNAMRHKSEPRIKTEGKTLADILKKDQK